MRKRKHLILLVTLVVALIMVSFSRHLVLGPLISKVLVTLVVLAVLLVVFERGFQRRIALVAAVAAMAMNWVHYFHWASQYQVMLASAYHALHAAFMGFAVAVILAQVFAQKSVTADSVLGAVAGYLLAAAAWANVYSLTELFVPGSFAMSREFAQQLVQWNGRAAVFDYFSLVTLSTMGYGDITPLRAPATAFATLEAVFGQFYIAVVVAQLVGLRLAQALSANLKD